MEKSRGNNSGQLPPPTMLDTVQEGMADFDATGEPYECHFLRGETLDRYAEVLGVADLRGLPIIRSFYANPVSGDYGELSTDTVVLDYSATVDQALQNIATCNSGLMDYTEDFMVGITVQVGEGKCISFGMEQMEYVINCADCQAAGTDDDDYGCGHAPSELESNCWLAIHLPEQADEIDWESGGLR